MMTYPEFDKVWKGRRGMRAGIRSCMRAKCVVSALTLMFSAVDALAALARPPGKKATRADFMRWLEDYLLPWFDADVTAADLYGARCGILHTYAPASDLWRRGEAKLLIYKWRHGHRPDDPVLEERARSATVIEIESLEEALERAVKAFASQIGEDPELRARVEHNVKELLCYEPWHPVSITVPA